MVDKQISAGCVWAYGLWAAALALWGVAWLVGSDEVGRLSIILCAIAATATIRTYFIEQARRLKAEIALIAFTRDSVRTLPRDR